MFLVYNCCFIHMIKHTLDFIEGHSVLVGVLTSVIVSSLWLRKYIKQKQAEAFFGFYAKLMLHIKTLKAVLEEHNQLNILNNDDGNIYSLMYVNDYLSVACPRYKTPDESEMNLYLNIAKELKSILTETENNVYPPGSKSKEWYESEYIILSFCQFIENDAYQHMTNESMEKYNSEPKHITKCKALIDAIDYMQDSIEHAGY